MKSVCCINWYKYIPTHNAVINTPLTQYYDCINSATIKTPLVAYTGVPLCFPSVMKVRSHTKQLYAFPLIVVIRIFLGTVLNLVGVQCMANEEWSPF